MRTAEAKAVRQGPWKLVVKGKRIELFNLDEDLGERNDVANVQRRRVAQLRDALTAWETGVDASTKNR